MTTETIANLYQTADWKKEKHVPVIDCPDTVKANEVFAVKATIGKEIAHPNTTAHHIAWVKLYFHADGEKFPCEIGYFQFSAHGASGEGPDTSTIYTHPEVVASMKTGKSGTLYATSYCNIHGLWQSEKAVKVS